MSRVVHFEIPTIDGEASSAFYSRVFDWQIQKWEGPMEYWLIRTGEPGTMGIDGAFYRPGPEYSGIVNTVGVADVDETLARVQANGGTVIYPKGPVPGVGWLAYARDPQGNVFGLLQPDEKAGM